MVPWCWGEAGGVRTLVAMETSPDTFPFLYTNLKPDYFDITLIFPRTRTKKLTPYCARRFELVREFGIPLNGTFLSKWAITCNIFMLGEADEAPACVV